VTFVEREEIYTLFVFLLPLLLISTFLGTRFVGSWIEIFRNYRNKKHVAKILHSEYNRNQEKIKDAHFPDEER